MNVMVHKPNRSIIWALIILILNCAPLKADNTSSDPENYISSEGEYAYRIDYPVKKGSKAFAYGPLGVFAYAWESGTIREAKAQALKQCELEVLQKTKRFEKSTGEFRGQCKILAEDKALLNDKLWVGPEWQKPSHGADIPLQRGLSRPFSGGAANGVILYVHGCNGLTDQLYENILGDYFNALGFHFFAPDSFSEPRPVEICGVAPLDRLKDASEIIKLRISQTQRTVLELKRRYPGLPLYVWGHSEGAAIVNMLDAEVSGMISSGDECNVVGMRVAAPPSVPLLFMFGDHDKFVDGFDFPLTDNKMKKCLNYTRTKRVSIVVVKDNKHDIYPWRRQVADAISTFIGAKKNGLPRPLLSSQTQLTAEQIESKRKYSKTKNHRAFAVKSQGVSSYLESMDSEEDAVEGALYFCAKSDQINMFESDQQHCEVIDIDGRDTRH